MRYVPSLGFEALEARQLLSKVHPAHTQILIAQVATPLALNGTLDVDNKAATVTQNEDGSETTSTPISGTLSGLGKVRGVWNTNLNQYGTYDGPDSLELRNSHGVLVIAFNNAPPHNNVQHSAHGAASYTLPQSIYDGTRAYANATESGTITLTTNNARTALATMTLTSQNP